MTLLKKFVTAKLKNSVDSRQGIVISETESEIIILGESGTTYVFDKECNVVPVKNLWGTTLDFYPFWS